MAANVLFKKLSRAQFDALLTKDNGTLYRVTESDLSESFYQGSNKLNNAADISAAIAALDVGEFALATENSGVVTIKGIKEVDGAIAVGTDTTKDVTLAKVATTGAAEDVGYDNTTSGLSADDVQEAIDALAAASSGGVASKTIWVNPNEGVTTGYLKTYGIYQGENSYSAQTNPATLIGKIDIPKDLVVTSGSVGTVTTPDVPYTGAQVGDKYIDLAIANQTEHIYIPANSLVDIYTVEQNATQIQLAIDSNNEISATIVAGSVGTTELAASAVTHAKLATDAVEEGNIKDGEVTLVKLASGVQTSLGKADTAVQSVTASDPTTGTNGTITVDGSEVAVKGLGTAAFTNATAYDTAGSAAAVAATLSDVATSGDADDVNYDNTTSGLTATDVQAAIDEIAGTAGSAIQSVTEGSTDGTIAVDGTDVAVHGLGSAAFENTTAFDAAGAATTAENNAKAYAEGLLTWEEVTA